MALAIARIGAAIMLLVALGRNSYDPYTIMRWIVCGVAAYGAFTEFELKRSARGWAFVIIAVAFNPAAPVRLNRETWAPIDVLVAGILIGSVVAGPKATKIRR